MYGSIYPQKLQDKCLTRRAHGNSDYLTRKPFWGRKDRPTVSLWGEDIYREKCPGFPKCPGQVLGLGVSKMLLCFNWLEREAACLQVELQVETEECLLLHAGGSAGHCIVL